MGNEIDISGRKFGRLTAIERLLNERGRPVWRFLCDCGNEKVALKGGILSGQVRSCGCLHKERCASGLNALRHGHARRGAVSRLHNIWRGMLKRVDAKIGSAYMKYALRGIGVCPTWREFEPFRDWSMANGYADDLTIDRKDNDGDYSPTNCRWANWDAQARNRRNSRRITAFGKTMVLVEWEEHSGLRAETIAGRIDLGWSPEDAVSLPLYRRKVAD